MQGGPSVEDYLKARDAIEPERRVIVVVGITGAGKSSTANTIRGSRAKEFEVADSLSSVRGGVRSRRRVVRGQAREYAIDATERHRRTGQRSRNYRPRPLLSVSI